MQRNGTRIVMLAAVTGLPVVGAGVGGSAAQVPSELQSPSRAAAPGERRATLDNGIRVLLLPVPGADSIGLEAFYNVGFVHEPADMSQAAHLLEHLVCNAATAGYGPNESMKLLDEIGMANAETMGDWTHYDYGVPPADLEKALRIEAERLTSLRIDEPIIRQEAPRCCSEVDFVERNPKAGMTKFAFMALNQAWRHGRERANVRTGIESYDPEALAAFHRATYRPDNLTLVLVGGFEADAAMELIRKCLGGIRNPEQARVALIDWAKTARRSTVRWDSSVAAVCIAFDPPVDRIERIALSLWGSSLHQALWADAEVMGRASAIMTSSHMWSVGDLPFFVYAAAKPEVDVEELERLLIARIDAAANGGAASPASLAAYVQQLEATTQRLNPTMVEQSVRMLKERAGDESRARTMVLGQGAINWGVADRLLGDDPRATVQAIESIRAERLSQVLRDNLAAERRIVTRLLPDKENAGGEAKPQSEPHP